MRKIIHFGVLVCLFANNVAAKSFNEMLELAIENQNIDAIKLILRQKKLAAEEKKILVGQAQEIIDACNDELDLKGQRNSLRGIKRIMLGGVVLVPVGFVMGLIARDEYYPAERRYKTVQALLVLAGGFGMAIWGTKAYINEEYKSASGSRLDTALRVKDLLEHAEDQALWRERGRFEF